ncbi:hypothetical protein WDW89_11760 [Deltaproteobacteria bacterium TL4]
MSQENIAFKRPDSIKKISDKLIYSLEDKRLDFLFEACQQYGEVYKNKRFWPLFLTIAFSWLVFPLIFWLIYRYQIPEGKQLRLLKQELNELRETRERRTFWRKIWNKRNRLPSENIQEINQFYNALIQAIRQYNMRIDLFDYTLDRQSKKLDHPLTVGELEQLEETFQRLYDELSSAIKLLEIAEQNPELDIITLLKNQYGDTQVSVHYLSQTSDLNHSGQLIQDLLLLESELRADIEQLTGGSRTRFPLETSDF